MTAVSEQDVRDIGAGYDPDPAYSMSLRAAAYTDPKWQDLERLQAPSTRTAVRVGDHRRDRLPYHAWVYNLDGTLRAARRTDRMPTFDKTGICLDQIQVEEFGGFVYANHCHIAHPEFVSLVDMRTYEVRTHGIWSSHFAEAGKQNNPAYDVSAASVTQHAVWWLWPNTCLLRYPGRGNFMVFQVVPAGPGRTLETWDFFFETDRLQDAEAEAVRYIDEVLQKQDISIVESVQRGMATPAFDQGRIVADPEGSGLSEHGVHHFHGLVLKAYAEFVNGTVAAADSARDQRHQRPVSFDPVDSISR